MLEGEELGEGYQRKEWMVMLCSHEAEEPRSCGARAGICVLGVG